MQFLPNEILSESRKEKMKQMEFELNSENVGALIECPFCHYQTKIKRFTGKIFQDDFGKSFKCFACGIWRKI